MCACGRDGCVPIGIGVKRAENAYALVITAAIVSGTMVGGMGGRYVPWPT